MALDMPGISGSFRLALFAALMRIKEELEDPSIVQRIHSILNPLKIEFTRLDAIAEVLFSTTEDLKQDDAQVEVEETVKVAKADAPKFTPVAFHEACVLRVQSKLNVPLLKRSRAGYSSPDKSTALNCCVSKEHNPENHPGYWFAFHPHHRAFLKESPNAYAAFGCGRSSAHFLSSVF